MNIKLYSCQKTLSFKVFLNPSMGFWLYSWQQNFDFSAQKANQCVLALCSLYSISWWQWNGLRRVIAKATWCRRLRFQWRARRRRSWYATHVLPATKYYLMKWIFSPAYVSTCVWRTRFIIIDVRWPIFVLNSWSWGVRVYGRKLQFT